MPKLKRLSGPEVVKILENFGFATAGQKGSHIKLKRMVKDSSQTLTIPRHKELDKGTLQAIYRQASRYVDEDKLRPYFYTN